MFSDQPGIAEDICPALLDFMAGTRVRVERTRIEREVPIRLGPIQFVNNVGNADSSKDFGLSMNLIVMWLTRNRALARSIETLIKAAER